MCLLSICNCSSPKSCLGWVDGVCFRSYSVCVSVFVCIAVKAIDPKIFILCSDIAVMRSVCTRLNKCLYVFACV